MIPISVDMLKEMVSPDGITHEALLKARQSFWAYCKLIAPKMYRADRPHLNELCDALQGIFEGTSINPETGKPYRKLLLNLPPRHGKSYTLTLFAQWCLGRDNETRIITVSYNDILAGRFAKSVRDGIEATKIDPKWSIFADVFPRTRVKYGDASAQLWSLEGQYFSYLATGFGGTITGIGCSIGIIDDPIRNNEEAYNERRLEEQWAWYVDTFLSRLEQGAIQIVNMTRWSTRDLCGRILDGEDAQDWLVFCRPACTDEARGLMLCPSILSYDTYIMRRRLTSPEIMDANYQQQPVDVKGKLYTSFATYEDAPRDADGRPGYERIIAYCDTADTGADYLCLIIAGEHKGKLYVLDVLYTDKAMEYTEPESARLLNQYSVNEVTIESNSGGRGFARNVERLLWEHHQSRRVHIEQMHQTGNKVARILSNATYVMEHIHYPTDWQARWPQYHAAMTAYQRAGKNKHDDAPDATTGLAEMVQSSSGRSDYSLTWI